MTKNIENVNLNFFIVGAAKSGTTAMHNFLRQHPQIYMPLKKEIHHFANDILKKNDFWLNPEPFFNIFKKAKKIQICGETSVFYMISENAASNIYKHNPNSKIIIMLRNPVEVMYSLHSQLVFNGEETLLNFNEVLELEEKRKNGDCLPQNTRITKKHIYYQVVNFAEQILRFKKIFPENQIKIIFYEDFKNNTLEIIRETYNFLEVNENFIPKLKLYNENKKIKNKFVRKFTDFFSYKFLSHFFHVDSIEKFRDFMIKINSIKEHRKPLENNLKMQIISKIKHEILKLEEITNTKLNHWYE
jgi:hypothetical protein